MNIDTVIVAQAPGLSGFKDIKSNQKKLELI